MDATAVRVIDKATGAEFDLWIGSWMPPVGDDRLYDLGFVVGERTPVPRSPVPLRTMLRAWGVGGDPYRPDADPAAPDELRDSLARLPSVTDPSARHFLLQTSVRLAYTVGNPKGRSAAKASASIRPETAWRLVQPLAWQWIIESDSFKPHLLLDETSPVRGRANMVVVAVFDDLRKHLEAGGFGERALDVRRLLIRFYSVE